MYKGSKQLNRGFKRWTSRRRHIIHNQENVNNTQRHNHNLHFGVAAGLMTAGALSVFTAASVVHAADGDAQTGKNSPGSFSDWPTNLQITEAVPTTKMSSYGAAIGGSNPGGSLLGSKMEITHGGYKFLAFCVNFEKEGPHTANGTTSYKKETMMTNNVQKMRRAYIELSDPSNDVFKDKFGITNDDDKYMIQQIAFWMMNGNFPNYNPDSVGSWNSMTGENIGNARREKVKKAVDYLIKQAGSLSAEQPGVPVISLKYLNQTQQSGPFDASGKAVDDSGSDSSSSSSADSSGDSSSSGNSNNSGSSSGSSGNSSSSSTDPWTTKWYQFDVTKNYWFSTLTMTFNRDKLPAEWRDKVTLYYHDSDVSGAKGNVEVKNDQVKIGDGHKHTGIGRIWFNLPPEFKKSTIDISKLITFNAHVSDYSPTAKYVHLSPQNVQDMAVTTTQGLDLTGDIGLSNKSPKSPSYQSSGKSTALDTDSGTQSIPTNGMDNVNLRDSFHLTNTDPNASFHVVSELIDPRTGEALKANGLGTTTQAWDVSGAFDTIHDFNYQGLNFTQVREDKPGKYQYYFRTTVYKNGALDTADSDSLDNNNPSPTEMIYQPKTSRPVIHSWATDVQSKTQYADAKVSNLSDRISLSQLASDRKYKVVDTLVDPDTGEPVSINGSYVYQTREFTTPYDYDADNSTAERQESTQRDTTFDFNNVDLTGQQGKTFQFKAAVYDVTDGDRDDFADIDWSKDALEDSETTQFIHVPKQNASTQTANAQLIASDNTHPTMQNKLIDPSANTTLKDYVHLENLVFNHDYTITEKLMRVKSDGSVDQVTDNGTPIQATTDFTAQGPSSDQVVNLGTHKFDKYRRQNFVVYMYLTPKEDTSKILFQEEDANDPNEALKVQDEKQIRVFKRDEYGRIMKNIKFTIYRKDEDGNWQSVKTATTNDDGYALFDDLEPDIYQVREDTADSEHEVNYEVQTVDTTPIDQNTFDTTFVDKTTPDNPSVKSKVYDNATHTRDIDAKPTDLKDDLELNDLLGTHSYTVKDVLYDPETGQPVSVNGKTVEQTQTVEAGGDSGQKYNKQITMTFDTADFSKLQGKHYAFVTSIYSNTDNGTKGKLLYFENSLNEANQTVTVQRPQVTTDAVNSDHQKATNNNAEQETKVLPSDANAKLMDHTYIQNVVSGHDYTVHEQVMVKDGKDVYAAKDKNGNAVTTTKDFTADNSEMNIDVNFPGFDTTKYKGKDLVVYYQLTPKGNDNDILDQHNDKDDWRETVHVQDLKKIKIYKYDTNGKPLKNTKFSIYQKNDDGNMEAVASAVTNDEGWATFDNLEPGTYYASEDTTDAEHEIDQTNHPLHEIDADDINQATYYVSIMDNTIEDKPVITSRAYENGTNNKTIDAKTTSLRDDLQVTHLDSTHKYHVVDTLMDPQTGKPANIDGHEVTTHQDFTANGNSGEKDVQQITMKFDPANFKGLQNHDYYMQAKIYSVNDNKTNGALLGTEDSQHDINQIIHVSQPTVTTKAASIIGKDTTSETQQINPYAETQLVDHTYMNDLIRGNDYTIHEQIMEKTDTGVTPLKVNGKTITATQDFTAENTYMDKDVKFGKFDSRNLKGKDLVIYYTLTPKDEQSDAIVVKNDRNDKDETIHITNPTLKTTALIDGDKKSNPSHYSTLADKVEYGDVAPNQPMTLSAVASDKDGNAIVVPGTLSGSNKYNYLMGRVDFTPTDTSGEQQVPIQMAKADSDDKINIEKSSVRAKLNQLNATQAGYMGTTPDLTLDGKTYENGNPYMGSRARSVYDIDTTTLAGKDLVMFEDLNIQNDKDTPIASHADVDDKGQTVHITKPRIYTMALLNDHKVSNPSKTAHLYDKVRYEDVAPGHEINFSTLAMDNKTGKPIVVAEHDNNYNLMGRLATTPTSSNGVVKVPLQMVQQGQAAAPTSNSDGSVNAIINTSNVNQIQAETLSSESSISQFQKLVTNFNAHNDTSAEDTINRLKGYSDLMNRLIYNGKAGVPDELMRAVNNLNATLAASSVNTSDVSEETDRLMEVLFKDSNLGYFITQDDYSTFKSLNSATSGSDNSGATATNGVIRSNAIATIPYTYRGNDGYFHTVTISNASAALSAVGATPLSNSNVGTVTASANSSAMASSGSAINATSSNVLSGSSQAASLTSSDASKTLPTTAELESESAVLTRVYQNNLTYTDSTADTDNMDVSSADNANSGKSSFTNNPESTAFGSQYNIDTTKLRGITMTMAEDMTASDDGNTTAVATDANLANTDQSVRVTSPTIQTMQTINNKKEVGSDVKLATFVDKVQFKDMAPGEKTYMNAVEMDQGTAQPVLLDGQYLIGRQSFTPENFDGTIEVNMEQRDDHPLYKYLVRDLQDNGMPTSNADNTSSASSTITAADALNMGSKYLSSGATASADTSLGAVNNSAAYENDADASVNTDNATARENTTKDPLDLSSLSKMDENLVPKDRQLKWTAYETAEGSDGSSVIAEHKDINSKDQTVGINIPKKTTKKTTTTNGNGGGNNINQNSNNNNNKTGDNKNTVKTGNNTLKNGNATGGTATNGNVSGGNTTVNVPGTNGSIIPQYMNGQTPSVSGNYGYTGPAGTTGNGTNGTNGTGSNTPTSTGNGTTGTGENGTTGSNGTNGTNGNGNNSPYGPNGNLGYAGGNARPNNTVFNGPQMQFARTSTSSKLNDNKWYDKVYNWFTKLF